MFGKLLFILSTFAFSSSFAQTKVVVDQEYYPTLMAALEEASISTVTNRSVDLLSFSFAIDSKGQIDTRTQSYQVAKKLVDLQKIGAKVRVYIEGTRDTAPRNKITGDYLSSNGIEVRYGATHAKGFYINRSVLLFGSTNLTNQSMMRNNETNVYTMDALVGKEFGRFFNHLWDGGEHGGITLQAPAYADAAYESRLLEIIDSATVSLDFSIYYFNHKKIEQALINASKRGVIIRGYVNFDSKYAPDLVVKNKETVVRLKAANIKDIVLDMDVDHSHSKYLIKDGKTIFIGTGNWNTTDVTQHPQFYVELNDAYLAKSLSTLLSQQMAFENSEAQTPVHHRFWEGYKKQGISAQEFAEAIPKIFIPATAYAIGGSGGLAYQPVLIPGSTLIQRTNGILQLPDEVALVSYHDSRSYRAARESDLGQIYGPLHKDYFLMDPTSLQNSKSIVSELLIGDAELNKAYELSQNFSNWQSGEGRYLIHLRKDSAITDAKYLEGVTHYLNRGREFLAKSGQGAGWVILVKPEYIMEYIRTDSDVLLDSITNEFSSIKQSLTVFEPSTHTNEKLPVTLPEDASIKPILGSAGVSVVFSAEVAVKKIMSACAWNLLSSEEQHALKLAQIKKLLSVGKNPN